MSISKWALTFPMQNVTLCSVHCSNHINTNIKNKHFTTLSMLMHWIRRKWCINSAYIVFHPFLTHFPTYSSSLVTFTKNFNFIYDQIFCAYIFMSAWKWVWVEKVFQGKYIECACVRNMLLPLKSVRISWEWGKCNDAGCFFLLLLFLCLSHFYVSEVRAHKTSAEHSFGAF